MYDDPTAIRISIQEHGEYLAREHPDEYGHLSDEELYDVALADLEAEAEEMAIAAYEDSLNDPYYV